MGRNFNLRLDVRSRDRAGYIYYVVGKRDGLALFIQSNGNIRAECDNGGGLWSVEVEPPKSICDGDFHRFVFNLYYGFKGKELGFVQLKYCSLCILLSWKFHSIILLCSTSCCEWAKRCTLKMLIFARITTGSNEGLA